MPHSANSWGKYASHHLPPGEGRRVGLKDIKTEKLALPFTDCSNQESEPCTSPGRKSKAGPGDVSVGALDPRLWEQGKQPCSLVPDALCELAEVGLECSPGWGRWRQAGATDQLSYHPDPEPGLGIGPSQHPSHLWTSGVYEGARPADSKLKDLQDIEQQVIQEESQQGLSIDRVIETRGLKLDKRYITTNTCK